MFSVNSVAKMIRDKLEFMAESLAFSETSDRKTIYEEIAPQIEALTAGETDLTANLANITAVIKEAFGFFWVGFYLRKENQLVLNAFQGTIACTRIDFDKGVCGHAFTTKEIIIVPNVDEFPGHIACASASKSEIVVPIFDKSGSPSSVRSIPPGTRLSAKSSSAFSMIPVDFWSWMAAAETAAWHLKWVMIPVTLLVLFGSRKLYRSMLAEPSRFCGQRYALSGYLASATVPLLVLILIGITVPTRLERHQWGIEARSKALAYATARVLVEYRDKFGTLPSEKTDLARLPDPDGSIAALLKEIDASEYKVSAEVAAVPTQRPRPLRGAAIRNASLSTGGDEPLSEALSLTNYELRLPGADKLLNTEDDLILIDGVTYRPSEVPGRGRGTSAKMPSRQP